MRTESRPRTRLLEDGGRSQLAVRQLRLRVVDGPDAGAAYLSRGEQTSIGTHASNDLVLSDDAVSRFHCELAVDDAGVRVRDLGSRNGTLLDGVSVLAAHVRDGATLAIGCTRIKVRLVGGDVGVPLSGEERFGKLVGGSLPMRALYAVLERVARTDTTVLLLGETGTGKDLVAESLHGESARRDGPFVVVDCGAVPPGLLESELFGHEKGAFTGATETRVGAFEAAHGGTLFLDELGELAPDLQPKLLRALETRTVQRVGGTRRLSADVRLLCATNRDLKVEVNRRRFRSDLYYRVAVVRVTVPPLRDRPEDIPALVACFTARMGASAATAALLGDPGLVRALKRHAWPGNVRELANYVERCLALGDRAPFGPDASGEGRLADASQPLRVARERCLAEFERRYLEDLLRRHEHNVSAAARTAGIDRVHLHRLLARHGLRR